MLTRWMIGAFAILNLAAAPFEHVSSTPPRSPHDERAGFRVPAGFAVQLVAAEPQIRKPINMAFDARGRLWVTESVEYPYAVPPGRLGRDRLVILSDFGPDGLARKVETFADGLNIPIGVLPLPDCRSALVFSIPNIYLLRDTQGTGRADSREVILSGFGQRDTHGLVNALRLGLDGWVYACHGFANDSTIRGKDGSVVVMNSGNTFRFRPDGSRVEIVTRGQVNPFGMAFDPFGFIYTADCHSKPITQLIRQGTYTSFSKPHDGLGFAPELTKHGHESTALCGLVYYDADYFPATYRDCMFLGNVVTNRINFDAIRWAGSSPQAHWQPDFLTSEDPWFRPVDLQLGPDGALYIADFYNRIIGHYEVPLNHPGRDRERGRIWRIVRADQPPPACRDWTQARLPELAAALGSANIAVRYAATHEARRRGRPAEWAELLGSVDPLQRAHALWAVDASDARVVQRGLADRSSLVRAQAVRLGSPGSARLALTDPDPRVRRIAAEFLLEHPEADNAPAILAALSTVGNDPFLRYTLRVSLRGQFRDLPGLLAQRGWSPSDAAAIADIALGIPTLAAADFLVWHLSQHGESTERLPTALAHIARYGRSVEWLRGELAKLDGRPGRLAVVVAVQKALDQRGADEPTLRAEIARLVLSALQQEKGDVLRQAVDLCGVLKLTDSKPHLTELLRRTDVSETTRAAAAAALAGIAPAEAVGPLGRILTDNAEPAFLRERAAAALGSIDRDDARAEMLKAFALVPARLAGPLAQALAASRPGAKALLDAVAAGKASPRLLTEPAVRNRLAVSNFPGWDERVKSLTAGLPSVDEALAALMRRRREDFQASQPDLTRGREVFVKNCAACHMIANEGAKIGPQLDGVGIRGLDRLLEDILDPSRNVDQAFRATTVAMTDGRVLSGLVLREEGEIVVLADAQGKELELAKKQIEAREVSALSPMPAKFGDALTPKEMRDLLGYLLRQTAAK